MVNDANDKEVIGLRHIIIYYLRYWKLFAAAFAVSLVGALLYLLLVPKTYEIAASIQVQDERDLISSGSGFGLGEAAGLMKSFGLGGSNVGGINMDDELMVLNSNDLVRKMVLDLGINVEYSKPFSLGYKLYGVNAQPAKGDSTRIGLLHSIANYLASEEVQSARFDAFSTAPTNVNVSEMDKVTSNQYVKAINDQAEFAIPQTITPPNLWSAPDAFYAQITEATGPLTDEQIQAAMTVINNNLESLTTSAE